MNTSPVTRLENAIERLESWRSIKVHLKVSEAIAAQARLGGDMAWSALGLITLSDDRTIDAQLALLRLGIEYVGISPNRYTDAALALADAILGGTK